MRRFGPRWQVKQIFFSLTEEISIKTNAVLLQPALRLTGLEFLETRVHLLYLSLRHKVDQELMKNQTDKQNQ